MVNKYFTHENLTLRFNVVRQSVQLVFPARFTWFRSLFWIKFLLQWIHVLIVYIQKLKAPRPPLIKKSWTLELNSVPNRLKNNSFWHLTNSPDPLFAHAKVQCCYVSVYRAFTTLIKTTLSISAQPSYTTASQQVNFLSTGVTNSKGSVVFVAY